MYTLIICNIHFMKYNEHLVHLWIVYFPILLFCFYNSTCSFYLLSVPLGNMLIDTYCLVTVKYFTGKILPGGSSVTGVDLSRYTGTTIKCRRFNKMMLLVSDSRLICCAYLTVCWWSLYWLYTSLRLILLATTLIIMYITTCYTASCFTLVCRTTTTSLIVCQVPLAWQVSTMFNRAYSMVCHLVSRYDVTRSLLC